MTAGIFRGRSVVPGFGMRVIGVKEVEATFRNLLKGVKPSVKAEVLLAGAEVVAEEVRDNILDQELVDSGDLYDSIEVYKINQWSAGVRSKLVYAAVHEFGLENQLITEKQRRFFWFMFSSTGDDMWKALALSTTYTIPARPYFRPAVDSGEVKREAALAVMRSFSSWMTRRARVGGY